jgi:hypothetical protein
MNHNPRSAKVFIALMAAAWIACIAHSMSQPKTWHIPAALVLLGVSLASSRMKVKLPGLTGTMSVNLPFLLLAVSELSLMEAMAVACANALLQTFPKDWSRPQPERLLFNASTAGVASTLAWQVFHRGASSHVQSALLVVAATSAFFLAQTLPVATVITLTGGGPWRGVWTSLAQLTFPYFVLSAGVAYMMAASAHLNWRIPVAVLPVMFGVFLSYRLYFRMAAPDGKPMAFAASAGH